MPGEFKASFGLRASFLHTRSPRSTFFVYIRQPRNLQNDVISPVERSTESSLSLNQDHHGVQLRPLIPKTVSQMRPEPFQIERTFEDKPPVNFRGPLRISEKAEQEFDRRSLGQKKRECVRVKAALLDGPTLVNPRRSAAQRGRRQRELAKQIQGLLQTKSPENVRSRAQTLRRRVEEAEGRLEFDAACGTGQVVENRYWDRRNITDCYSWQSNLNVNAGNVKPSIVRNDLLCV
ncbi:hypothetical protein DFH09DRAFT_1084775 [Mycena vulgaris]|nr:hypothetical protein DFH09DRAFT_1084775 [Mycena vulgaris]